jgi:dihydrodipicolinate synthase/N-acetylneuraminate lyase
MKQLTTNDLRGVFAVPPLARNKSRAIDLAENEKIVRHIQNGGISRLIYGGNAFLYHLQNTEFEVLLEWLSDLDPELWLIPSLGPTFGRALDQAAIVRKFKFGCVMMLPCSDPRDAGGLERGYREIAEAANAGLIIYLKEENNFGSDKLAGLDSVARLVDDGVCIGIKYAVIRDDPTHDEYLEALLARVDRRFVISGIGERPAVVHLRDWKLPGFTTGSGCLAPALTQSLFQACERLEFEPAMNIRELFMPHEDLRDAWGPARVIHHSVELAGIAKTGPIAPYVSELSNERLAELKLVAFELASKNGRG